MDYQSLIRSESHFFPVVLVKAEPGAPTKIVEHLGTGFFMLPGVLLTCWHCVADPLPPGHEYAIRVKKDDGKFAAFALRGIERDRNRTDMATAFCPYTPPEPFRLAERDLLYGEDVWTFGFPYPETRLQADGSLHHVIGGR